MTLITMVFDDAQKANNFRNKAQEAGAEITKTTFAWWRRQKSPTITINAKID